MQLLYHRDIDHKETMSLVYTFFPRGLNSPAGPGKRGRSHDPLASYQILGGEWVSRFGKLSATTTTDRESYTPGQAPERYGEPGYLKILLIGEEMVEL